MKVLNSLCVGNIIVNLDDSYKLSATEDKEFRLQYKLSYLDVWLFL